MVQKQTFVATPSSSSVSFRVQLQVGAGAVGCGRTEPVRSPNSHRCSKRQRRSWGLFDRDGLAAAGLIVRDAPAHVPESKRAAIKKERRAERTFTFEHDDARQEVPDRSDRNSISRDAAEQLRVRITDDLAAKFKMEIDALKKSHVDELTRARETISKLEEQARDHMDALEKAQSQLRSGHVKETRQPQQQISEAEQEKRVLQELADRVPFLENEVARLNEQLTIPHTPSMLQYRSLEMKIETLMQKHLLREAELKVLLSKATQSSELEKLQMERIHQNAIAAKNVEIRHFKKQLDDILYELELLRQPQAP